MQEFADLVREYQWRINASFQSETVSNEEAVQLVYKFQNVLRQFSLFFTGIRQNRLPAFLISGNLVTMSDKKSCFSSAFPNMNFITTIPNYLNFLRSHTHFLANIMYNSIEKWDRKMAETIGYSTIPSLFQNGWCAEEDALWCDFLVHYVDRICGVESGFDVPDGKHFAVFRGFFIEKLCLDYLQVSLFPDLERINWDPNIRNERVRLKFDGNHLLPSEYIRKLEVTAKSILEKLRINLPRVPVSVRRLLAQISEKELRIGICKLNGVRLACLFFINCALVPILNDPYLIGIEKREAFVFEDLANLFFFCNFQAIRYPPPFVLSLFAELNPKNFLIDSMVSDLIDSVKDNVSLSDFHEEVFARVAPTYQKTALFLPIDLFYLHKASVSEKDNVEIDPALLSPFDFLLNLPPAINKEEQYDMMSVTLKPPQVDESYELPEPISISAEVEDAFQTVLDIFPAHLAETATPKDVLGFLMRKEHDVRTIQCLQQAIAHVDALEKYTRREITCYKIIQDAQQELMVTSALELSELRILFHRTFSLNNSLLCTANKILIRTIFKSHLFRWLSEFDDDIPSYFTDFKKYRSRMCGIADSVLRILEKHGQKQMPNKELGDESVDVIRKTVFALLIDRITLNMYLTIDRNVVRHVREVMDASVERWKKVKVVDEKLDALLHGTGLLEKGVEILITALCSDVFSTMLHFLLKAIETIVSSLGTQDRDMQLAAISWVLVHSNVEKLIYWYLFINKFCRQDIIIDSVGGMNISYFSLFTRAMQKNIIPQAKPKHA